MGIFSQDELEKLQDIIRQAGDIALSYFCKNVKNWQKSDATPISEADLKVNDFLEQKLKALRPEFGWLSEETVDNSERCEKPYIWVIDPIDGTKAFINNRPEWVISVAIVKDCRPVLGLIYNPVARVLYFAEQGGGAFANNLAITPNKVNDLHNIKLLAYRFHFERMAEINDYIWTDMQYDIVNSMALRVALVASGVFDAMVCFTNKSEWDIAAADIIIHEAGGIISDGFGQRLKYNKPIPSLPHMVAAGKTLHATIITHTVNFNFEK